MSNKNKTLYCEKLSIKGHNSTPVKIESEDSTLELAGTVNITDSGNGSLAGLSISGIPVEDYIGSSTIVTAAGTKTLDEDDSHVICVRAAGDSQDIDLVLPEISTLSATKRYHISIAGDVRSASDTKDAYYVSITCSPSGADVRKGDTFDHIGKDSGVIWICKHPITSDGSLVLQSVVGLNPGVGTTNGWVVVSSHFDKKKNFKDHARLASTGNETLANLIDGYTVDGKALQIHDRLLLKDQSTASQNGIYTIQQTDPPFRTKDLYDDSYAAGSHIPVVEGTANGGKMFRFTNTTETSKVGTDNLTLAEFGAGGGGGPFSTRADVTQATSVTTSVTANGTHGTIELFNDVLNGGSGSEWTFQFNNSELTTTSIVLLTPHGVPPLAGQGFVGVHTYDKNTGFVDIVVYNCDPFTAAVSDIIFLDYIVIN